MLQKIGLGIFFAHVFGFLIYFWVKTFEYVANFPYNIP